MSPRTIGRIAALLAIAWCIAARAGAPHCTRADWQSIRLRQMFEHCRDTRGGPAQRACEARYAEFVSTHFQSRALRAR